MVKLRMCISVYNLRKILSQDKVITPHVLESRHPLLGSGSKCVNLEEVPEKVEALLIEGRADLTDYFAREVSDNVKISSAFSVY